jgi:hypothetical protein
MILKKDMFLEYIDRNKRSLSISTNDYDLLKQLIEHVSEVAHLPNSRYFAVLNHFLTANPDLTTRLKISLERMYEDYRSRQEEERREEIM